MLRSAGLKYAIEGASNIPYSTDALAHDLERIHDIFGDFKSSRERNAVYSYLSAVFELVEWWTADKRESVRALLAMRMMGIALPDEIEPFAAVIVATAHPTKLDKRVISKWSRALRYAAKKKRRAKTLQDFVTRKGGINACAARYAPSRATAD